MRGNLNLSKSDLKGGPTFSERQGIRAREEMDFIAQELSGAVGLGGRDRKTGSSAEKARVNVTRAIRSALARVAEHDTELGQELEATVRTGTFCSYMPDPRRPVEWTVEIS